MNSNGEPGTPFFCNSGGIDSGHSISVDTQGRVYAGGIASDQFLILRLPGGTP